SAKPRARTSRAARPGRGNCPRPGFWRCCWRSAAAIWWCASAASNRSAASLPKSANSPTANSMWGWPGPAAAPRTARCGRRARPGRGGGDEIGARAEAVETLKVKAIEQATREAAGKEAEATALAAARRDDMRKLAASFEATIGTIVQTVSSASTQLEAAASTLTNAAESTQALTTVAASAAEEASTNVQSVASATEQLSSSVSEVGRQVHESSRIADEAVRQAERTDARIGELSQAASRIGDVVKLITAIADQTNLLALNATIEAARAGDAGRGFAVVAQEVKALAAQTGKATDEIGTQIASMQTATQESVGAIKEIGTTITRISTI